MSEALIFASTNPQYIWREIVHWITSSIHENSKLKSGENTFCTEIVSDIQNNFCKQHVLPMFFEKKRFWQRFTCTRCNHWPNKIKEVLEKNSSYITTYISWISLYFLKKKLENWKNKPILRLIQQKCFLFFDLGFFY